MISEGFFGTYEIGHAPWNVLQKEDYLEITRRMQNVGNAALLKKTANGKHHSGKGLDIRITIVYDQMQRGEYSEADFCSAFSSYTNYEGLILTVCNGQLSWSYRFTPSSSGRGFSMSSGLLTLPELKVMADDVNKYVEQLYSQHTSSALLDGSLKESMESDVALAKSPNDEKEPCIAHSSKGNRNSCNHAYKWIELVRAVVELFRSAFFRVF